MKFTKSLSIILISILLGTSAVSSTKQNSNDEISEKSDTLKSWSKMPRLQFCEAYSSAIINSFAMKYGMENHKVSVNSLKCTEEARGHANITLQLKEIAASRKNEEIQIRNNRSSSEIVKELLTRVSNHHPHHCWQLNLEQSDVVFCRDVSGNSLDFIYSIIRYGDYFR